MCANASHYFRSSDARCHSCGNVGAYAATFVGLLAGGVVVIGGVLAIVWSSTVPKQRLAKKLVQLVRRSIALWSAAGMRNKFKCEVA